MFVKNSLLLLLFFLFLGCKTNQFKNNKRNGVWVESYSLDTINYDQNYKSREIYKLGKPVRTWKYYKNNKLIRKEKYKKDFCLVTHFYENGKIEKRGKTNFEETEKESHWYYTDTWEYFDVNGKFYKKVKFYKGQPIVIDSILAN